jgi:hypothetical protein
MRIFSAVVAIKNWITIDADAVNNFTQSPPPAQPTYERIEWLKERKGIEVEVGDVCPVLCPLQCHTESGSLWADKVEKHLKEELQFTSMVKEPCIYIRTFEGHPILIGRQVDDLKVAGEHVTTMCILWLSSRQISTLRLNKISCHIIMAQT